MREFARLIRAIGTKRAAALLGVSRRTVQRWQKSGLPKKRDRAREARETIRGAVREVTRAAKERAAEERARKQTARDLENAKRAAEQALKRLMRKSEELGYLTRPKNRSGHYDGFTTSGFEAVFVVERMLTAETISHVATLIENFRESQPKLPTWLITVSLSLLSLDGEPPDEKIRGYVTVLVPPDELDDPEAKNFLAETIITSGARKSKVAAKATVMDDLSTTIEAGDVVGMVRSLRIQNYRYRTPGEITERESDKRRERRERE